MHPIISKAIQEMKLLSFTYDGHHRIVEPHCHGITTAGNLALRCYQTAGGSVSGKVPGWHLMTVDKMFGISLSDNTFNSPRPDYKRGDKNMSRIFYQL